MKTAAPAESWQTRSFPFGIDAPYVPAIFVSVGTVGLVGGVVGRAPWLVVIAIFFLLQAGVFLHTTLRGKFIVWRRLLDGLDLSGDEELLDLGCGRGAVLVEASRQLPQGTAHGIDLWRTADQSGNAEEVTRRNAESAGTGYRVRLHTGDITEMDLPDDSFDVVVSSLAIHNITSSESRADALDEALRVLRPGGRLVIADIRHVKTYASHLRARGCSKVEMKKLGPLFWFGGPWQATTAVAATSPTNSRNGP